jgi:uncharacterized protein (TIGR03435 family)
MNKTNSTITLILAAATAFGQAPAKRLEFEVASIRPSAPIVDRASGGVRFDGALVNCSLLNLNDYLGWAYKVKLHQLSGPDWLGGARFDLQAKLPPGATNEQIPEMLQALLAERFGLKVHHESKEFPVYALVVGKTGVKMKEAEAGQIAAKDEKGAVNVTASGSAAGTNISFGNGSYMTIGNNTIEGKKLNTTAIADTLGRFVDLPVVDLTDLKGNYDFTLQFTPEDFRAMMIRAAIAAGATLPPEALKLLDGASGDSLFSAIEAQGLKLEKRRVPIDVVVIDHIEKSPTDN